MVKIFRIAKEEFRMRARMYELVEAFDFSNSFYGQFAIAHAVSDLLLDSLGIDRCCGQ